MLASRVGDELEAETFVVGGCLVDIPGRESWDDLPPDHGRIDEENISSAIKRIAHAFGKP
jgi:hypothetical protein